MLDTHFIKRKIKLIQEDISVLEKLSSVSFDELMKDSVTFSAVERFLEKIIMRAIDINQHIIAEVGKGDERIRGYEDTFYALTPLGVYDAEFAKRIAPSAGLRNRIIHEYNDTNREIIYQSVGEAIAQFTRYTDAVLRFLENNRK